jgi:glutathione S-transferase
MAEYRLHCFAQSGNAYKAALMLALAGADWEPVFVDYFNGATHTPEFRALNEMGEVPLLEEGDLRLSQSGVILDHLSRRYPDFGPRTEAERREILRWTLWDNHKLTSYLATLRFQMKFLPEEKRQPQVIEFLTRRSGAALQVLDRHLFSSEWIAADHLTTADVSCAGYLFYDHEFPHDLATFPNVDRWRQAIAGLPGWKHPYDLMPGHPIPPGARS